MTEQTEINPETIVALRTKPPTTSKPKRRRLSDCGRGLVSEEWHVVPVGDLREHESLPSCWCKPRQDEDEPLVWVHNSMDRREHTVEKGIVQ
jgi:hypothetical protein